MQLPLEDGNGTPFSHLQDHQEMLVCFSWFPLLAIIFQ